MQWHLDAPIPTKEELREGTKNTSRRKRRNQAGEPKEDSGQKKTSQSWRLLGRWREIRGMHLLKSQHRCFVAQAD
ncbi:hypothetical protein P7H17_16650 [Paenibacillus larvae]|nr:hypothetical protein [Paenibacillus larvae]MDT2287338.1 hypothetical protein [Paenibacillus larvae]